MKSRYILGAVFIIAVVVIGFAVLGTQSSQSASPSSSGQYTITASSTGTTTTGTSTTSTTSTSTAAQSYTMAQVAQHKDATSCWSAINGKVYDLTSWINQHPGGPEHILSICGSDGSSAFNAQHGGQSQPAQILQQFYIGTLAS